MNAVYLREVNNKEHPATKKTTNADELSRNERLGQTNTLEARLLAVESMKWVGQCARSVLLTSSQIFSRPARPLNQLVHNMSIWQKKLPLIVCLFLYELRKRIEIFS